MREVEGLLVAVDLAEVHQEVEVDSVIAVGLGTVAEVEAVVVDRSRVAGADQGAALAREEGASEGEDESIFSLHAFQGVRQSARKRQNSLL